MCHFWPSQLPLGDDQYKTSGSRQKKENKEIKRNALLKVKQSRKQIMVSSVLQKETILSREDAQDSVVCFLEELLSRFTDL